MLLTTHSLRPTSCSTPPSYDARTPPPLAPPPGRRQRAAAASAALASRSRSPCACARRAAPQCAARAPRALPRRSRCAAARRRHSSLRRDPTITPAISRCLSSLWLCIQGRSATMVARGRTTSARAVPSSSGWCTWRAVRADRAATPSGLGRGASPAARAPRAAPSRPRRACLSLLCSHGGVTARRIGAPNPAARAAYRPTLAAACAAPAPNPLSCL